MTAAPRKTDFSVYYTTDYEVTYTGCVISHKYGKSRQLVPRQSGNGYLEVEIHDQRKQHAKSIHRLVAECFHGLPPTPRHQARHLDGNNTNNHGENIAWGTPRENVADSIRHGTHNVCNQDKFREMSRKGGRAISDKKHRRKSPIDSPAFKAATSRRSGLVKQV